MVSAVRPRPGQLECTVAMACDTDGTRILLFHNLPISQKLSASYELSGEEKTRETAYPTIFYWKQLATPFFILHQQHNKHQAQMDGSTIVQDQTYSTAN